MFDPNPMLYRAWVLSSPARLAVWSCAGHHGMYVGDIARTLDLAPSTVSYHLAILREAGLVQCVRQGKYKLYAVTDERWGIVTETELDEQNCPAALPIHP